MASSSVSQEDHDVEHDFAMASRRAKVRSARANRTVNNYPNTRGDGECLDKNEIIDSNDSNGLGMVRADQSPAIILLEQNDASPKLVCRGIPKDKRTVARGAHAGKCNKGARDRRKLREKRRSTGVMHLPSTESTGGSTGEDENNENSVPQASSSGPSASTSGLAKPQPSSTQPVTSTAPAAVGDTESDNGASGAGAGAGAVVYEIKTFDKIDQNKKSKSSESDLDADDEANNSGDVRGNGNGIHVPETENWACQLKGENERLLRLLQAKDKRITTLELQVAQLTRQMSEVREENAQLLRVFKQSKDGKIAAAAGGSP